MRLTNISKSYFFQIFRHRIYVPLISFVDSLNDYYLGVQTNKIIELNQLGISQSVGNRYESVSFSRLKQVLFFAFNLGYREIIDLGSGMGRTLLVASKVGFTKLQGVEISNQLINICEQNFRKLGILTFTLHCLDVTKYQFPKQGKICVFMFNPFGAEIMESVISKIYARNDDTLVIYHNPKHSDLFNKSQLLKQFTWNHFGLYEEKTFLYLIPASKDKLNS